MWHRAKCSGAKVKIRAPPWSRVWWSNPLFLPSHPLAIPSVWTVAWIYITHPCLLLSPQANDLIQVTHLFCLHDLSYISAFTRYVHFKRKQNHRGKWTMCDIRANFNNFSLLSEQVYDSYQVREELERKSLRRMNKGKGPKVNDQSRCFLTRFLPVWLGHPLNWLGTKNNRAQLHCGTN